LIDFVTLPETSAGADTLPPPSVTGDARELLAQFAATGRQEPFEEIVRRYGGMVFNLCYEVTGNRHDAEDAVQAAFLSLAVQTKSGTPIHAVGPWLQQVARRLSLDINRSRKRRKNREAVHGQTWEARMGDARAEGSGGAGQHGNPSSAAGWEELRTVVQHELNALPPKYRLPLILHYYGGLSRDDMARELNCKANTLGVRLHRGRDMLAKRLAKRGITISGVVLGVLMSEVVHSIVSDHLVHSTAQAAVLLSAGHPYACGMVAPQVVTLAQSGARALASAKIKFAAALALLAGGAAAAGAQVVTNNAWGLPQLSNWNLVKTLRGLFHFPSIKTPIVSTPNPNNDHLASGQLDVSPAPLTPVAPPHPVEQYALPQPPIDYRGLVPFVPRSPADTGYALQPFAYPPTFNNAPDAVPYPLPPYRDLPTPKSGFAGGGGGGGGSGGKPKDTASPDNKPGKDSAIAGNRPGKNGKTIDDASGDNPPSNDNDPQQQAVPPGRGGVKPRPTDIAKDGPPAKPSAYTPDDVAHGVPVPPRIEFPTPPAGKPPVVGPLGPTPPPGVVPPQQDANHVDTESPPDAHSNAAGGLRDGNVLRISTDYAPGLTPSFDQVVAGGLGKAYFQVGPGDVAVNRDVLVGHLGAGVAVQTGGVHTLDSLFVGDGKTGVGLYQLTGGELQFTTSPTGNDLAPHSLEIGGAGQGTVLLGNADSTGQITQVGETGGPVNLTVGAARFAVGILRGWGNVGLTGRLTNNGQIVADGYGQDRSLDLTTFAAITNDYANRNTKGWYAVNRGRLELPAIPVARGTNTYTWGQNADEDLTLVNTARITFHDVEQGDATVKIALLALDRTDTPAFPSEHHLVGMWSFDQSDLTAAGGMDLLVRYDDALAAEKGLDEHVLKLWKYDGQWERLDFDPTFLRDPLNHTLFVHTDATGVTYFAVSAPEPTTTGLVLSGLVLTTLRRRRQR